MQKRLISMVLALSMALTAMPLPALAQSAPPDTASAAALAEENDDVTDIFPDDWSGVLDVDFLRSMFIVVTLWHILIP